MSWCKYTPVPQSLGSVLFAACLTNLSRRSRAPRRHALDAATNLSSERKRRTAQTPAPRDWGNTPAAALVARCMGKR